MSNGGTDETHLYTYLIPTNFPTKNLEIFFDDREAMYCMITTPIGWDPGREVEIDMYAFRFTTPTSRYTKICVEEKLIASSTLTAPGNYRAFRMHYYPHVKSWICNTYYMSGGTYRIPVGGGSSSLYCPTNGPSTVEEWLALQEAQP